jgi:hypothetical protein
MITRRTSTVRSIGVLLTLLLSIHSGILAPVFARSAAQDDIEDICQVIIGNEWEQGNCQYMWAQIYCDTGDYCDVSSTYCEEENGYHISYSINCYGRPN